ncbi:DNA-(apurinic or apyrimidinic site) endonuclease [Phlebotomus argentipes]|uniref:DNA-(apurinic or apyrimidinic site) endonuclease n=1 Tax=Phlebotomus argentipes TaxID=94469 RepID=UPI0028930EF0|nr:DNA-(apurinic or apyrimidinic site) endonuclease [Phlebotomus argentipes]XP_059618523.1 DNA-(apurinic or apyrimidinic site) endonuclease [Phlebotomus argentipes]
MPPKKSAKKPEATEAATEAPVEQKKRGKRAADDGAAKKASPAKKARTKKTDDVAEPQKKGRGKKAAPPPAPEDVSPAKKAKKDEEPANDAASPAKSPKRPAAKAKASPKKKATKKTSKSPVANGSGRKKEEGVTKASGRAKKAAPSDDAPDSTAAVAASPKAKKGRATKAAKSPTKSPAKSPAKAKAKRGRKPKAAVETSGEENGAAAEVPKKGGKVRANATVTNYSEIDFTHEKPYKLKIASWNVSGMRAWIAKGGLEYVKHEQPDVFCLQEIKCKSDDMPPEARVKGYHPYWLCHSGYAGVAIYAKAMPMNVTYGIGDAELDEEGRVCTAEFEKFYLVCVYVPNAGRGLVTLPKRLRFDEKFHAFVSKLDQNKPVIICGDMNVAHQEIDLANPKTNKKNAGFTQEERDSLTKLFCLGFVDTFRHLYPKQAKAYTFWTYMMNARSKNVGWRLDYFIVSERLASAVVDNIIRSPVMGSDHCPIVALFDF